VSDLYAVASGKFKSIIEAMAAMNQVGKIIKPDPKTADYHAKKYKIFLEMYEDQIKYKSLLG
jgi:ribulose kinase